METELKEFGLSENESKVYLTLLKTGTSTANRIAELTGMKRSTTYDTLRLLTAKGIASTFVKDKKNYFESAQPSKLIELLKEKQEIIEKIIPELEEIQGAIPKRSTISFFEGKKGVWLVHNDMLETRKEIRFYGSRQRAINALQHYPGNFVQKRVKLGLRLKAVIAEEDRAHPFYKDPEIKKLSDIRFLKELNGVDANTFIYGTKVAFMSSGADLVGIVIESPSILKQQKRIFEILWNTAKPVKN